MVELLTQPNTHPHVRLASVHTLPFSGMCPISHNPQVGSTIEILYRADETFLEVYSLRKYIDSYRGGKDEIRDMEGMIQRIALDCATTLQAHVTVKAHAILQGRDALTLIAEHNEARLSVAEIAQLTNYTERQIRNQCESGTLKATLCPTGHGWQGYKIKRADYQSWITDTSHQRRRWRGKREGQS